MKGIYLTGLAVLLLAGCGNQGEKPIESSSSESSVVSESSVESSESSSSSQENTEVEYTIEDFFPNTDNQLFEYTGKGNEFAGFTEYTVYSNDNRKQYMRSNAGTTVVEVVALQQDKIVVLYHEGETDYRENVLDHSDATVEVLLQGPFEVGTSWEAPDGRIKTITALSVPVTTEFGEQATLEVTTKWKDSRATTIDYYAPGIGLVKSVFTDEEGNEVLTELATITETPFEQTVRFYYPNSETEQIEYVDTSVLMNTNDHTKDAIESAYKETPEGLVPVLSENVQINHLFLNKDGRVHVDFSQELITEMNAGAMAETLVIQSLVNTIGAYYNVDEVYLTVEGKPYQTGHIEMQEGEYFQVHIDEAMKY